jgi:hypothetical protein
VTHAATEERVDARTGGRCHLPDFLLHFSVSGFGFGFGFEESARYTK